MRRARIDVLSQQRWHVVAPLSMRDAFGEPIMAASLVFGAAIVTERPRATVLRKPMGSETKKTVVLSAMGVRVEQEWDMCVVCVVEQSC